MGSQVEHLSSGSPAVFCPSFFLTPFFWVVNVSLTNLAACRMSSVAVAAKTLQPQLKAVSSKRNGVISDLYAVY